METNKERNRGRKLLDAPKSWVKKLTSRSRSSSRASAPTVAGEATVAENAAPRPATAVAPTSTITLPIKPSTASTSTPVIAPTADPLPQDEGGEIPEFPLWDTAFQELLADPKSREIVTTYQEILEIQAARIPDQQETSDDAPSQPQRFSNVIKLGMDNIDAKMWKINLDPERPIVIREQVNRILKTVKKFSGVAAMAASFDPVHAGVAWAGVSAILPFLLNISEQEDNLREGLEIIADLIAWHTPVELLLLGDPVKRSNSGPLIRSISRVYKAILIYQAEAARYVFRSTLVRTTRNAVAADTWKDYLEKIKEASRNCNRWVDLASTTQLSDQISEVQKTLNKWKQESSCKSSVLGWLSDQNHAEIHRQIQRDAGEGYRDCGAWLLQPEDQDAAYPAWKLSTRGQLSLQGSAGTGKSTLASMVIEDLTNGENPPNVAFYYCKRETASSVDKIMQSLVSQLAYSGGATTFPRLEYFYKNDKRLPAPNECVPLLLEAIGRSGSTYIVVDGWDESDAPNALLKYLKSVWEGSTSLKIFLSSRIEDEVKFKFPNSAAMICNKETNDIDIRSYIRSTLKNPDRRNPEVISETMAQDMTNRLIQNASGMFLWVKLQLELLISEEHRIDRKEEFNRGLERLSSGSGGDSLQKLRQTYRDILTRNLQNQGDQSAKSVREALKWVACSVEPLRPQTLLEAVKMNTKDDLTIENLWKWSRNLLGVDATGIIRFTHLSVREFVESEETLASAHDLAALTCLECVLRPNLKNMYPQFCIYALLSWPFHCGNAALAANWYTTAVGTQIMRILTPEIRTAAGIDQKTSRPIKASRMLREFWISDAKKNGAARDAKLGLTMMHDGDRILPDDFLMACYMNWQWLLNDLKPADIRHHHAVLNMRKQSGLHLAVKQGHVGIVKFLLECEVDPDCHDSDHTTPLGAAILSNQPDMVTLLLSIDLAEFESGPLGLKETGLRRSRADVNASAYRTCNTALHLAALYNLPEVADLLCQAEGINLNVKNENGATALIESAVVGSKEVARILIDREDIDLNITAMLDDGNGGTEQSALHGTESPEIVKMLLDKDPELANLRSESGLSVLSHWLRRREPTGPFADAAYERNLLARLDILLPCIDPQEIESALQEPACMQSVPVLTRLWDDPRSSSPEVWQDTSGDTLLHKAAARGNTAVINFLLDHGADATALDNGGKIALKVA